MSATNSRKRKFEKLTQEKKTTEEQLRAANARVIDAERENQAQISIAEGFESQIKKLKESGVSNEDHDRAMKGKEEAIKDRDEEIAKLKKKLNEAKASGEKDIAETTSYAAKPADKAREATQQRVS